MTTVDYYMIYAAISQGRLLSKFQLTDMELEMARAGVQRAWEGWRSALTRSENFLKFSKKICKSVAFGN